MKNLTLTTLLYFFCLACEDKTAINTSKTEIDFTIVPVLDSSGLYQYIDLSQNGKIVIEPQFKEAYLFKDDLARVKNKKYGYIDKKGNLIIDTIYEEAQDFNEGVAWVQIKDEPPMLIDKNGKMLLQIDSLEHATYFHNGISLIEVFSPGKDVPYYKYIDKKGNLAATTIEGDYLPKVINDGLYAFKNNETNKWGFKNMKGKNVIESQFDRVESFIDGMAVVIIDRKYGVIDKKGNFIIKPQYDRLSYDSDSLFITRIDEKCGWFNKNNEIVINPQFDSCRGFFGNKLAPVNIDGKWGYVDKKGQLKIEPQFDIADSFGEDYAMVANNRKIGFINQKGDIIVPHIYNLSFEIWFNLSTYNWQKEYGITFSDNRISFGDYAKKDAHKEFLNILREKNKYKEHFNREAPDWVYWGVLREAYRFNMPFYTEEEIQNELKNIEAAYKEKFKTPITDFELSIVRIRLNDIIVAITPNGVQARYIPYSLHYDSKRLPLEAKFDTGEWLNIINALHKYRVVEWKVVEREDENRFCLSEDYHLILILFSNNESFSFSTDRCYGDPPNWENIKKLRENLEKKIKKEK